MVTRKYITARLVSAAIFIYLFGFAVVQLTLLSKYDHEKLIANFNYQIITDDIQNSSSSYEKDVTAPVEISSADRLRNFLGCLDKPIKSHMVQSGEFLVLYNYVRAQRQHRCHESITFTTQGDFTLIDNLVPVVERWNGPVSVAIYAPGDDFQSTVDSIKYLRECTSPMVKQYITFHIFFNANHMPSQKIPTSDSFFNSTFNCLALPPYLTIKQQDTYKTKHNLTYPINVGRNVARLSAQTHFVFPSDIELYPSPNIIPKFLDMISKNEDSALHRPNARNSANVVDIIGERERELAPAPSSLMPATTTQRPHDLGERLLNVLKCHDRSMSARTQQRGDYWVLYNYVRAEHRHRCHESVTYTTHADYTFMDNLVPLVERWNGPISVAMHAPGTDFAATLATIGHLRDCTSPLVKKYVTFHIFFSTQHAQKRVPRHDRVLLEPFNCSITPPYLNFSTDQMYKTVNKLLYPINFGRNVARESAQTHFVFASDIELYPSPNLIPQFLEMIAENKGPLLRKNPKVFVLSIFEVAANYQIPDNKTRLKEMLANGTAIIFHQNCNGMISVSIILCNWADTNQRKRNFLEGEHMYNAGHIIKLGKNSIETEPSSKICDFCHNVPKSKEWQAANETKGLHIFHIGKRTGMFDYWEPIFIGTHADPLYDERLSWEGKADKMTQGYALCVLDYDFQILDNAFLCHKPGIKTFIKDPKRDILVEQTQQLIKKIIFPELKILYGIRKGCVV